MKFTKDFNLLNGLGDLIFRYLDISEYSEYTLISEIGKWFVIPNNRFAIKEYFDYTDEEIDNLIEFIKTESTAFYDLITENNIDLFTSINNYRMFKDMQKGDFLEGNINDYTKKLPENKVENQVADYDGALQITDVRVNQTAGNFSKQVSTAEDIIQKIGSFSEQTGTDYTTQIGFNHVTQNAGIYAKQKCRYNGHQTSGNNSHQEAWDGTTQITGDYSTQIVKGKNGQCFSGNECKINAFSDAYIKTGNKSEIFTTNNSTVIGGDNCEVSASSDHVIKLGDYAVVSAIISDKSIINVGESSVIELEFLGGKSSMNISLGVDSILKIGNVNPDIKPTFYTAGVDIPAFVEFKIIRGIPVFNPKHI